MRPLNSFFMFCVLILACGLATAQCASCTVWTPNSTPTLVDSGEAASVELGMKFRADSDGYVTGIRFYKSVANSGTHTGNLWSSSGSLLATAQFTGESASGWQQVSFSIPVPISAGTTYLVSYFAPLGHYAFDMNFFATSGVDNAPLHALADGVDGANGVFSYGFVSSFPNSSYASTNYWVDVVYVPKGATLPAPTVTTTAPANAAGGIPIISNLSATFSAPMDPSSINASTFQLFGPGNSPISGVVSYSATTTTATFQPTTNLAYQTTYTAVVRGAARDFLGDVMGSDFTWTFTTESASSSSLCPCTIWPSTTLPGVQDSGESAALELGVKFGADLDGYLTGIRFYKSTGNTGTHIGNIWSTTGVLLGSATFTGESASGWQQATFASPVQISAGTTYIASYFTSAGHYAFDQSYFSVDVNNVPLHASSNSNGGGNGVYIYTASSAFPTLSYNSSNYWVDVVYVPRNSSTAPVITGTTPGNGTTGAPLGGAITARFSEPMDPPTITSAGFQLADASHNVVPGTVSYVPSTASLLFQPGLSLTPETVYTATVRSTVRDTFGNALASDYSWNFTTALPPGESGPGGPILVIASSVNPFSSYFGEILLAEGMNEFRVKDITTVTPDILAQYDIAILGDFTLTGAQVSMLTTWVNNGGGLIAMHPDPQLATLLGLTSTGGTLSDGYLLIKTQAAPGKGIVGQTIQFHGSANLYSQGGATAIATLYSGVSTPTTSPAVTLANAGAGQAAAFTYDLAKSVVMLRQGNPTWSGQDRDGYVDPEQLTTEIRANDLFYGNASFDPQPDWVNLSKVQIPQADEQQRLLTNLIQLMNTSRKPLPRFWYLPSGFKAAVVMTGDEHGGNGTGARFDTYISESPANCSVADWTCVRATSYMFPANVTLPNYQTYLSQGFEIANHADNNPTCTTFTAASLDAALTSQLSLMTQLFPAAPPSQTNRTHCVLWSDYDTEPGVLLNHGIRFDTTYYYWPDMWVQGRPGLFTGSGMPMRFADRNGNIIDVYQATTQFPDETTWNFPADIDTVLDNAVGANGYYAVITSNMHMDHLSSPESDSIVAEAQSRGVPIVTSLQMLTWLDGRNNSTFSNISWSTNTLSFTVTAASGARNLQVLVPAHSAAGSLVSLTLAGAPVTYSVQTIKGLSYAAFLTTGGAYQAVYVSYSVSGVIAGAGGSGATVTLSGTASATTTADSSGTYSFSGLDNGSYTVTPRKTGYTFTPTSRAVVVNGANVSVTTFTSTAVPIASLSSSTLPFGNQPVNTTSAAQIVTLSNTGAASLTITSIAISGTNSGDFATTNTCGSSLAGGANCSISVTFKPTVAGVRSATLSVTDNAGGSPQRVTLTGTGTGPTASLSSTSLAFGVQAVNTASTARTVTLTNTGNASMSISGITVTGTNAGDFSRTTTCGTTLSAGANCTISVTFLPTSIGARTASISVGDNAPGNPHAVALTGTGTGVTVTPTSLSFASQSVGTTSAAQVVTLKDVGTTTLSSIVVSVTGTSASDFGQTATCGTSLAAASSCTVSVTFTPSASGTRTATLRIADSDPTTPQQVTLTGTGTSPTATLSPTSLAFAVQALNTTSAARTITLRNSGNAIMSISSISITGTNAGDFARTTTCGTTLAAAASCTISVTFRPTATGTRTASVSIADNAPGNPHTVPLTGTGTGVTVTPTTLTFASRTVGTTSSAQTVTVRNVGTTALTIAGVSDTGTNAGDFNETNTCGVLLNAGASCTVSVTFRPSARGTRTATLQISDADPASPQQVNLTGSGQ
jgi:hypothetical protein